MKTSEEILDFLLIELDKSAIATAEAMKNSSAFECIRAASERELLVRLYEFIVIGDKDGQIH